MTIPGVVRFADPLSSQELQTAREIAGRLFEVPKPGASVAELEAANRAAVARLQETQKWLRALVDAYSSDTARVRLAELTIYRAGLLSADIDGEIAAGEKRRSGPTTAPAVARMVRDYVTHYVEPVLPLVREMTGYEDGAEREGWYLEPEEIRARLVGEKRTRERLAREGRSLP